MPSRTSARAVLLAFAFAISGALAACGGGNSPSDVIATTTAAETPAAQNPAPVSTAPTATPEAEESENNGNNGNNAGEYTIQAGDTLGLIAQQFGVTIEAIVELNNIANPDLIIPGETIEIPGQ